MPFPTNPVQLNDCCDSQTYARSQYGQTNRILEWARISLAGSYSSEPGPWVKLSILSTHHMQSDSQCLGQARPNGSRQSALGTIESLHLWCTSGMAARCCCIVCEAWFSSQHQTLVASCSTPISPINNDDCTSNSPKQSRTREKMREEY